jgi:hypothetical protein
MLCGMTFADVNSLDLTKGIKICGVRDEIHRDVSVEEVISTVSFTPVFFTGHKNIFGLLPVKFAGLERLYVSGTWNHSGVLFDHGLSLLELHIALGGSDIHLADVAKHCNSLTSFKLSNCNTNDNGLIQVFKQNPNLNTIVLIGCDMLTNKSFISGIAEHLHNLRVLEINLSKITPNGIIPVLRANVNLYNITIDCPKVPTNHPGVVKAIETLANPNAVFWNKSLNVL